jgi:hypothetical protein
VRSALISLKASSFLSTVWKEDTVGLRADRFDLLVDCSDRGDELLFVALEEFAHFEGLLYNQNMAINIRGRSVEEEVL